MPWPQTGATQYNAQLGLSDKGRAIKGLVVCYALVIVANSRNSVPCTVDQLGLPDKNINILSLKQSKQYHAQLTS